MVRVNGLDDGCYIRPLVYLGYGEMGLNPIPCPVNVSIAAWPWGTYLGDEGWPTGCSMKISSWRRHDPNAVPTAAKGTGHVRQLVAGQGGGLKAGYDEAILLAPDGNVSECTGENIFIVRKGRLITPPASDCGALEGITQRRSRPSPGTSATGCPTSRSSAPTSTRPTRPSSPVRLPRWCRSGPSTIARWATASPGPITQKLQQTYFATVRGEVDQYKDWLDYVE